MYLLCVYTCFISPSHIYSIGSMGRLGSERSMCRSMLEEEDIATISTSSDELEVFTNKSQEGEIRNLFHNT